MASFSSGWDSFTALRRTVVSVICVTTSVPLLSLMKEVVHGVFLNTIFNQLVDLEKIVWF